MTLKIETVHSLESRKLELPSETVQASSSSVKAIKENILCNFGFWSKLMKVGGALADERAAALKAMAQACLVSYGSGGELHDLGKASLIGAVQSGMTVAPHKRACFKHDRAGRDGDVQSGNYARNGPFGGGRACLLGREAQGAGVGSGDDHTPRRRGIRLDAVAVRGRQHGQARGRCAGEA